MTRYKYMITAIVFAFETSSFGCSCGIWAEDSTELFNKKDLQGWKEELEGGGETAKGHAVSNWLVRNGILESPGRVGLLRSAKSYGDSELTIEWRADEGALGFISLRNVPCLPVADFARIDAKNIAQLTSQFGADAVQELEKGAKPIGEWNRYDIKLVGQKAEVSLNGRRFKKAIDLSHRIESLVMSAPISVSSRHGLFSIRTFKLRSIDGDEANQFLASLESASFEQIFNGKDLEGWTGALDDFQVVDEVIVNKQGFHGDIFTKKTYSDFIVRHEFKLPPAGNSGLAIRYQGQGDPHIGGMCELQILDSEHPTYASLDPRQYHGSPYGIAAAKRGFLRTTGEWNFQEVTVLGSQIKVGLNGFTILCVDLKDYRETKDGPLHEAIDVASGHFGIASHLDPVKFRQISIRELSQRDGVIECP